MASLQQIKPFSQISKKALPLALRQSLKHIFANTNDGGIMLVGGTALAGYYAEHRRSDDLDLFVGSPIDFEKTYRAVQLLKKEKARFSNEYRTPAYFRAEILWQRHTYTIDIVLDENLFKVGKAVRTDDRIWVADLETLFAMKSACLISRCSEKDLFDLDWLLARKREWQIGELIEHGSKIDLGLNPESLLVSLKGASLRKEACHFLLPGSPISVIQAYSKITNLHQTLIRKILEYEKKLPPSPEAQNLRKRVVF